MVNLTNDETSKEKGMKIDKKKLEEARKKNMDSIKEKLIAYTKFIESNYSKPIETMDLGVIGDMNRIDEHLAELEFIFKK